MTLNGAIKQLHELRSAEDMPIYYKPAIAEVINVLLIDVREVKHGRWIYEQLPLPLSDGSKECVRCSVCNTHWDNESKYCPNCGARMDEVENG